MIPFDLSSWAESAVSGAMPLALPVALLAGLVSFFTPCVVPLLPGYLAYATGMSAADITTGAHHRGRAVTGTALFVLGFAAVFVTAGVLFGAVGATLVAYQSTITRIVGVLTIAMGLLFAGLIPLGRRELRLNRLPAVGLAGAPLLGVVFGLGWTPCLGPTLSVVISLALSEGSASRGGLLAFTYAIGLGIPFMIAAAAFTKMARAVSFFRRHQQALLRIGGLTMVAVGLLLVTGGWDLLTGALRQWAAQFTSII
jgi:cytochrome c-type biogenesis protein